MKNFKYIIVLAVIFVFVYSGVLISNWNNIKQNLYYVSITDIFNTVITVFVGVFITYIVSIAFSKRQKQIEIVSTALDVYFEDLRFVMRIIKQCHDNFAFYNYEEIIHALKMASNDLATYTELEQKVTSKSNADTHKEHLIELRHLLTENKFNNDLELKAAYPYIFNCYYKIKRSLMIVKFSHYK